MRRPILCHNGFKILRNITQTETLKPKRRYIQIRLWGYECGAGSSQPLSFHRISMHRGNICWLESPGGFNDAHTKKTCGVMERLHVEQFLKTVQQRIQEADHDETITRRWTFAAKLENQHLHGNNGECMREEKF